MFFLILKKSSCIWFLMARILLKKKSKLCSKYIENRRKLILEITWIHWYFKIIYYCYKQLLFLQLYNITQNKHIIVYLTEVLVSYIQKFNVLHMAPGHCWNFSRDNFSVYSLPSLLIRRGLYLSKISGTDVLEARDWFIWKDVSTNYMVSYMTFREWGWLQETTYLP